MTRRKPPDDFIRQLGLPFMAHLLRRISDRMVEDAGRWEAGLDIKAPPRTASTMLYLKERGKRSVTEIAEALGQSHPLVITWIRQLEQLGFIRRSTDPADARRTLVALTPAGKRQAEHMATASIRIGVAYEQLLKDADAPVTEALWRLHDRLAAGRLEELLRVSPSKAR